MGSGFSKSLMADHNAKLHIVAFTIEIGLNNTGLCLFYPVNSDTLVVLYASKLHSNFASNNIIINDEKEGYYLNLCQLYSTTNCFWQKIYKLYQK